eukprot:1109714-Prymnesium_polylepis.2
MPGRGAPWPRPSRAPRAARSRRATCRRASPRPWWSILRRRPPPSPSPCPSPAAPGTQRCGASRAPRGRCAAAPRRPSRRAARRRR